MRIYIDTSVVGGVFDKEFDTASKKLFEKVKNGSISLVVSNLLRAELANAPPPMSGIIWINSLLTK